MNYNSTEKNAIFFSRPVHLPHCPNISRSQRLKKDIASRVCLTCAKKCTDGRERQVWSSWGRRGPIKGDPKMSWYHAIKSWFSRLTPTVFKREMELCWPQMTHTTKRCPRLRSWPWSSSLELSSDEEELERMRCLTPWHPPSAFGALLKSDRRACQMRRHIT